MTNFTSVDEVSDALAENGYIPDRRVATTAFLMMQLDRPVLVEGPAGVGKTELAKALSRITGRRLIRLQCYEGQDETKALYDWDYGKQLLYTQLLRDKIGEIVAEAPDLESAVTKLADHESVFFSERFLSPRPLLDAIRGEEPAVLLIDEIDRSDEALEAVLLEALGEFQISVPEIGTFASEHHPLVVLTSNNTQRPFGRAQAALPPSLPGLSRRRPRAGDSAQQGHRARRRAFGSAGAGRTRVARTRAAQGAQHLGDDRLGTHLGRARRYRAQRRAAGRHGVGRREVRTGPRPCGRRAAAPAGPQRNRPGQAA